MDWRGLISRNPRILGAGIIALPYALREAGLFTGTILIIILGFTTDWTIRLILLTSKMSGRSTYIDIMDACTPCSRYSLETSQINAYGRANRFWTCWETSGFNMSVHVCVRRNDCLLHHSWRHYSSCPTGNYPNIKSSHRFLHWAYFYRHCVDNGSVLSAESLSRNWEVIQSVCFSFNFVRSASNRSRFSPLMIRMISAEWW